jgi:hypothetical protein
MNLESANPLVLPANMDMHTCLVETYRYHEVEANDFDIHDWAATYIFQLTTYDYDISKKLVRDFVRVCKAITERNTFNLISDEADYLTFITIVNMPLFSQRLDWGTSIRGCWWVHDDRLFDAWLKIDEHPEHYSLTRDQWIDYMKAACQIFEVD